MKPFDELIEIEKGRSFVYEADKARAILAPRLGARVFCELDGISLHRLDIENVRQADRAFNNYGGNNFWPAPEGGQFGFNYQGDNWYVQPAVNNEPFELDRQKDSAAEAFKAATLVNRLGTQINVEMWRTFEVQKLPGMLAELAPRAGFSYVVNDRIVVKNKIRIDEAILSCWTLEQFDANAHTMSFVKVANPKSAINFDFYDDPRTKITYEASGFYYQTDSQKRGQIGIKKDAQAQWIGFYDLTRKLLCVRELISATDELYFNIADNDQPNGPFSAADNYSIFNGDGELGFFELETIGGAKMDGKRLLGSDLVSRTSFAVFDSEEPLLRFLQQLRL